MAQYAQKPMQYVTKQGVTKHGIVRLRDIEAIGIPREYLLRLYRQAGSRRARYLRSSARGRRGATLLAEAARRILRERLQRKP